MGLNMCARSSRVLSLRRCSRQLRMVCRMALVALALTAGVKLIKYFPQRFLDRRGRNVYPRKSKRSWAYVPWRIARYSVPRTKTIAGYDLTFSPVKSVSTLWAVADPVVAAAVERAHQAAVNDALKFIEKHALFTR